MGGWARRLLVLLVILEVGILVYRSGFGFPCEKSFDTTLAEFAIQPIMAGKRRIEKEFHREEVPKEAILLDRLSLSANRMGRHGLVTGGYKPAGF